MRLYFLSGWCPGRKCSRCPSEKLIPVSCDIVIISPHHLSLSFTHPHTSTPPQTHTPTTPPTHTHTSVAPIYGAPHTGGNLPRGPSYSVTATPPMTPREAIPPLTSFVANREHSHPSLSLSLSLSLSHISQEHT